MGHLRCFHYFSTDYNFGFGNLGVVGNFEGKSSFGYFEDMLEIFVGFGDMLENVDFGVGMLGFGDGKVAVVAAGKVVAVVVDDDVVHTLAVVVFENFDSAFVAVVDMGLAEKHGFIIIFTYNSRSIMVYENMISNILE